MLIRRTGTSRLARPHFDWLLCLTAYALAIFGVLAVSITNYNPEGGADRSLLQLVADSPNGMWQAIFVLITPIVIGGMMTINYRFLERIWPILYVGVSVLLGVVLLTKSISGVSGWFQFENLRRTLQPSEFAKIVIIITLASLLSRNEKPVPNAKFFLWMMVIVGIPLVLIIAQPDIGTMLVFIVIIISLLLVSGCSLKMWILFLSIGVVALLPIGYLLARSENWRWQRLTSFIDPYHDTTGAGYQIIQSMTAVGAGKLTGVGMFVEGTMTQLNIVPENHTDFIFSSVAETMGFVGCMILLGLYALMLYRMYALAMNTPDRFGRLVIMGVASMLLFHVFENVGMNIGVMPITGIPLPFISYGGSNLVANMAGVGLVLNVTSRKAKVRNR